MSRFFYPKLAFTNLKKNAKAYIPYIFTCIASITLFFIMHTLSCNPSLMKMQGSDVLIVILKLGSIVIAIFSCIFLFYTNSFLIKRRKKEFGLYNILGMEKKHISRVMFYETAFTAVVSLSIGILCGAMLNKLMFLLLLKLLQFKVQLGFYLSPSTFYTCLLLFGAIFTLTYLSALRQIHLTNPIELLKGSQVGEREPRTKWFITLLGVIALGMGYYIALTTQSPLRAIMSFFVAVLLVITGTYLLFMTGSIALLKMLRGNKRYYYKTKHFISVSGLIYRMKQNSVGLSNICILSTAVLVILSTTISLYIGMEDSIRNRYPRNFEITWSHQEDISKQELNDIIVNHAKERNLSMKNEIEFENSNFLSRLEDNKFIKFETFSSIKNIYETITINIITIDQYNKLEGTKETLKDNEIFFYSENKKVKNDSFILMDTPYQVKKHLSEPAILMADDPTDSFFIVLPDLAQLKEISFYYNINNDSIDSAEAEPNYVFAFDSDSNSNIQIEYVNEIKEIFNEKGITAYIQGTEAFRYDFLSMYGGLLFIGIFLGTLFVIAAVLIIYYKQISEGYDDRERYIIMQKVGMSKEEVKGSIFSQILTVFFLPLVTAGIHVIFALKMIIKLLALLGLTDINLYLLCTFGTFLIFGAVYGLVYTVTAKTYYKIVSFR